MGEFDKTISSRQPWLHQLNEKSKAGIRYAVEREVDIISVSTAHP